MANRDTLKTRTRSDLFESIVAAGYPTRPEITDAKTKHKNNHVDAAFGTLELLMWQLVNTGVLPASARARELERYARFYPGAEARLSLLAKLISAVDPATETKT